jgi:hypothetical protein
MMIQEPNKKMATPVNNVRSKRDMFEENISSRMVNRRKDRNRSAPPVGRKREKDSPYKPVYDKSDDDNNNNLEREYGPSAVWFLTGGYRRNGKQSNGDGTTKIRVIIDTEKKVENVSLGMETPPPPPLPNSLPPVFTTANLPLPPPPSSLPQWKKSSNTAVPTLPPKPLQNSVPVGKQSFNVPIEISPSLLPPPINLPSPPPTILPPSSSIAPSKSVFPRSRTYRSARFERWNDSKDQFGEDNTNSVMKELRNVFEEKTQIPKSKPRSQSTTREDLRKSNVTKSFATDITKQTYLNSKQPSGDNKVVPKKEFTEKIIHINQVASRKASLPHTDKENYSLPAMHQSRIFIETQDKPIKCEKMPYKNVVRSNSLHNNANDEDMMKNIKKPRETALMNPREDGKQPNEELKEVKHRESWKATQSKNSLRQVTTNRINREVIKKDKDNNSDCLIKCALCKARETSTESQIL